MQRQADIAIRLARPKKEMEVLTRRLGHLDYAVYTHHSKMPNTSPWIRFESAMRNLPQEKWLAGHISRNNQSANNITVSDGDTMLSCVKAGLGKAVLPVLICEPMGDLTRIGKPTQFKRDIWTLIHPNQRKLARIQVVMAWLEKTLTHVR